MGMLKPAFICWPIAALMTVLAWSATPASQPQKKAAATKAPQSQTKASALAHKSTAKSAANSRQTARRSGSRYRTSAVWRPRQLVPSADRYKEIQGALASRGYLQPEKATGVWDQNSVDALKRFQADQKLESSGRINSLSLIALGLGPKRDSVPKPAADPGTPQIQ